MITENSEIVLLKDGDKCSYEHCDTPATTIACGRAPYYDERGGHPKPARYCDTHSHIVADEDHPEYVSDCPNCGCRFGVN